MLGRGLWLKTTIMLVFFLCLVKSLKSWSCDLLFDSQYGFRSSWSTADLLTTVSDGISRAFSRSGATRVVAFLLHSTGFSMLSSTQTHGQIFGLILFFFLNNTRLRVGPDGKSSLKYLGTVHWVCRRGGRGKV